MFVRSPESYPVVPLPPDTVQSLRASGLSETRIARALRISPKKFKERVAADDALRAALEAGARIYQSNQTSRGKTKRAEAAPDENKFTPPVPLAPLDAIILNAIAAGTCDRPAIERLIDPLRSRKIQVTPSLERLIQHGKINPIPPRPGTILTKYELQPETALPAEKTGADDEPRRILGASRAKT